MENFMRNENDARGLAGDVMIDVDKFRNYMKDRGFKSMEIRLDEGGKTLFYFRETIINPNGTQTMKLHCLDDRYGDGTLLYTTAVD